MLINEIGDKKLKKPLEVTISKTYIAENEDLELFGEGNTEESAIEDIKEAFLDIYEDLIIDEEFTTGGEEYKKNFLAYVDEEELTPEEETYLIKKAIKKITS